MLVEVPFFSSMAARMPVGRVANEGQQQRGQSCAEKKSSFISDLHQFWK
jgi:hypothetical protein